MKLSFSTNAFLKSSIFEAAKTIGGIGYDGIEIVADSPHIHLPLKELQLRSLKKILKRCNLTVSNVNANTVALYHKKIPTRGVFEPSLSNKNKKLRNWRISYVKRAIDLAYELESDCISITSGLYSNSSKSLQDFEESLEEISAYGIGKNILIAIEYEPGLLIGCANDVLAYSNKYENIGLNFDICHAAVLGEQIPQTIKKFKKKIFHTHISDCKNRIHYHLIPGMGEIDFESMYNSLQRIGYTGFLTAELYTYGDCPTYAAKSAYDFLSKLVAKTKMR
jgi:sugar phosphate isomerase/epimerase